MGAPARWILWRNSHDLPTSLAGFDIAGSGENVGQHVALAAILRIAEAEDYDFIVKVDDDLLWKTPRWLKKMLAIEREVYAFSGQRCVFAPVIKGLKNPVPIAARIKLKGKIPLAVVPILGGACRLHHISFFNGYTADVRKAMGAGGDTSVAQHAGTTGVSLFYCPWVRIEHPTRKMEEADPDYFELHDLFQILPYIPPYTGEVLHE
jgi:glycosyltransferase involved in cell wall biosynthesis